MRDIEIKIVTDNAKKLQNEDWENIENLVNKFQNDANSTHNSNEFRNAYYYRTKLTNSPFGDSYITRVLDLNNNCLGFQSLTKKDYICLNKNIDSFEFGDVYLDKSLRGKGIFKKMIDDTFINIKKYYSSTFIYATANKFSQPGLIRGGFKLFDYQLNFNLLPLKPYTILNFKPLKFIFKILNPLYLSSIKVFFYLLSRNFNFRIKLIKDFNQILIQHQSHHDIELNKSQEYLNWRFKSNPHEYKMFIIEDNDKYVGYFIFREAKYKDIPSLFLADMDINKNYLKFTKKIFSKLVISNFDINKFAFIASCVSKKSNYWQDLTICLPFNFSRIPFIIYEELAPKNFMEIKDKKIQFSFGDGDNI